MRITKPAKIAMLRYQVFSYIARRRQKKSLLPMQIQSVNSALGGVNDLFDKC